MAELLEGNIEKYTGGGERNSLREMWRGTTQEQLRVEPESESPSTKPAILRHAMLYTE
jgi:hypothetical protein